MSNPIDDWFASAFAPTTTTTPAPSAPTDPVSEASASDPTPAVNGSFDPALDPKRTTESIISTLESYIGYVTTEEHCASPHYSSYNAAVKRIHTLDAAYWSADPHPIVDDPTYDRLMALIEQFEAKYHYRATDSPTRNPATTPSNGRKSVRRATPMLSTYKVHDTDAVIKWIKSSMKTLQTDTLSLSIEWKLDGVSVSLVYIDGILTEASEGKGDYGNDVLQHCTYIPSIPNILTENYSGSTECPYRLDGKWPHRIEIRGEVVCHSNNLSKAAAFGYEKNGRSAASGIMANRNPDENACALLDFVPWQMTSDEHLNNNKDGEHAPIKGQNEIYKLLFDIGFLNAMWVKTDYSLVVDENLNEMVCDAPADEIVDEAIRLITEKRATRGFPTDGIIFKVNVLDYWQRFRNTDKKHKYLVAYKFPAQTAETTLRTIDHTVGSTGKVTPVGYFDPVVINGATYSKASIGSDRILTEMNIHPGDRIIVSLRNDVIPHIDGRAD